MIATENGTRRGERGISSRGELDFEKDLTEGSSVMHVAHIFLDSTAANNFSRNGRLFELQLWYLNVCTRSHAGINTQAGSPLSISIFPWVLLMSFSSHDWGGPLSASTPAFLLTNPHQLLQSVLPQSQYSTVRQLLFPTALMNSFIWKPLTVCLLIAKPRPIGLGDSSLKIKSINQDGKGGKSCNGFRFSCRAEREGEAKWDQVAFQNACWGSFYLVLLLDGWYLQDKG